MAVRQISQSGEPAADAAAGADGPGDPHTADPAPAPARSARIVVHPHCHARAVGAADADRRLLELLGYSVDVLDAGCCGLAGSFGFRAEHEALSREIGEQQWLPRISEAVWGRPGESRVDGEDHPEVLIAIDGFSCATQYRHLAHPTAPRPFTLAEVLLRRN